MNYDKAVSREHSSLINAVQKYRDNLQHLMENDSWDKKSYDEDGKWRMANIFRWKKPVDKGS